jgi:chemotaxis protein MotB
LDAERALSTQAQRNVEALNAQVRALRTQLGQLQGLLDEAKAQEAADNVQMQSLGTDLNIALARLASEEQRRRSLEEAERKRLEEEARRLADEKEQLANQAQDLVRYRSEFFGRMRDIVANMDGVQIKGDRFVFSSEVLFDVGSADLSQSGMAEVAKVADLLRRISSEIPPEIDWLIRVDGHTDNTPLSGGGDYADNWELSQARALSVVRYLSQTQGIAPQRLAANGFGEYQPITLEDAPVARAQNRRIELKLTER